MTIEVTINDLPLGAIDPNMQLETDIGGAIVNKITIADFLAYILANYPAIYNDSVVTATGATSPITMADRFALSMVVENWGCKADNGITDNAIPMQNAINYAQTHNLKMGVSSGRYVSSATLNFKQSPGWGFRGQGAGATYLLCSTNNIPVVNMGATTGTNLANYSIGDFSIGYVNDQPSTNTAATCILFSQMAFQGSMTNIEFLNGYYAMKVASGIGRPWGNGWTNFFFGRGLTGGCYDNHLGTNATPNDDWGRFSVDGTNMTNILFNITGYNNTIGTLEFFTCPNSSQLINFGANSRFDIDCIKLETYSYTVSQFIINIATGCNINIGDIWVGGTSTIAPASGAVYLFGVQSGGTNYTRLKVKSILASATTMTANTGFLVSGGGTLTNGIDIGSVNMSGGWALQNNGSTVVANVVRVKDYSNGYLGADVGDNDLTLVSGDPTTQQFRTPFSVPRVQNLPNVPNNLCAAMEYTFVFNGAINGSNTATIKAGSVTYATVSTDKTAITVAWRRTSGTAANDWVVTNKCTLP